ncbi:ABC transporter ATP-binding protein [Candidatus Woesearchaeota archaeon]|nr:ABC transporter ATP-binding protein [Candidatus Woesearchaeota archaeon]HIH38161.1 ABC transporter ATP-binding protein [Candidatus Woesearchaeota archaeon]HIH49809.1 ABC transporter ATP-binding protein [Candidatus Woesearchaeota archaeon]HIJ03655.1 ABC transporter ATP-binding protein [Candidatus Woesearchaeota archaeon]
MIELVGVVKRYTAKRPGRGLLDSLFPKEHLLTAVDHVSLRVKKLEHFGLLGPNGAGKTSILSLIAGLCLPTSGTIRLGSKKIGVMLGHKMIYHRMTGYDNLKYFSQIYKVGNYHSRIRELSSQFKLQPFLHEYVERYSLGMRVKLALARSLVHDPAILLLDEPTLGLDIHVAAEVRAYITSLKKTIILTTHYLEEADELCERVAILNKGRIIAIDSPQVLKNISGSPSIRVSLKEKNQLEQELLKRKIPFTRDDGNFQIFYQGPDQLQLAISLLSTHRISSLSTSQPTLGDAFIALTGEELE